MARKLVYLNIQVQIRLAHCLPPCLPQNPGATFLTLGCLEHDRRGFGPVPALADIHNKGNREGPRDRDGA
jgi:hypothetical protein